MSKNLRLTIHKKKSAIVPSFLPFTEYYIPVLDDTIVLMVVLSGFEYVLKAHRLVTRVRTNNSKAKVISTVIGSVIITV